MSKRKKNFLNSPANNITGNLSKKELTQNKNFGPSQFIKNDLELDIKSYSSLINFDFKVKSFLSICICFFLLATIAQIHIISVPIWNQIIPDGSDSKKGLIYGNPRSIRMDDWAGNTPWFLSQANTNFSNHNSTIGPKETPILVVPTKHFSTFFKPDYWGFLAFDPETGFAWNYNLKALLSIVSAFLLFLILTNNNFWLSITGSFWLFLSTSIQSWAYVPANTISYALLTVVSIFYLLYSENIFQTIVSAIVSIYLIVAFALVLYPPFQVPIAYLILCIFIGYLIDNKNYKILISNVKSKITISTLVLLIGAIILFFWYKDVKNTLGIITNTVYPGKRIITGGDGFIANIFSEYFSWSFSDSSYPPNWKNYCEMSHYITFLPILIPSIIIWMLTVKRNDYLLLILTFYSVVMLSWIELGWPEWLSRLTLMSFSKGERTQIPFGVCGVITTIIYLDRLKSAPITSKISHTLIGILASILIMICASYINIYDSNGYLKLTQVIFPTLFFSFLYSLLLPTWNPKHRLFIFSISILCFLLPNLKINPLSVGLSPITENILYKEIRSIQSQDPKARWVVFGQPTISYMATSTGINLLSGIKYAPNISEFHVLDQHMDNDSAYNRYAHTIYNSYIDPSHPDTVIFQVPVEDHLQILMDPCSTKLKKLGVKYIIFDHQPVGLETRCMKLIKSLGSLSIYQLNY